MEKKSILLLAIGFLCISLYFYVGVSNFNLSLISNDSGFDTDYDFDSSSSSSSSSNSDYEFYKKKGVYDSPAMDWILGLVFASFVLVLIVGIIDEIRKSKIRIEDPEIEELTKKIFEEVQIAWMNFDYDKLKELVTDELYNMYHNQLQTLSVKGQKNVMSDFNFSNVRIFSKQVRFGLETISVQMTVEFIDYIADSEGNVVRGNKHQKVRNTYNLVFITNIETITECPNCNAPLSENEVTCRYCQTKIQGVRGKMKLSQKRKIR